MPMLRRGYGAVKNLRCKSGARFPPSTVLRAIYNHIRIIIQLLLRGGSTQGLGCRGLGLRPKAPRTHSVRPLGPKTIL